MNAPAPSLATFPAVIDSSMRASFSGCPEQFHRQYIQHLRLRDTGIHLHAGGAFAAGLDRCRRAYFDEGATEARAIYLGVLAIVEFWGARDEASDYVKSLDRVCGALLDYFCEYPLPTDFLRPLKLGGKSFCETNFALPIPGTAHPETGEPILYAGRFDLVAEYEGGLFIVDEKTTTMLGDSWLRKWNLRGQFFGYVWGARAFGIAAAGVITRGISFLKNSYGHAQVPVHIAEWQVERYVTQLAHDTNRMIAAWREGFWPQSFDDTCTNYGGCAYSRLCQKLDPDSWIDIDYERSEWQPLKQLKTSATHV